MEVTALLVFTFCIQFMHIKASNAKFCEAFVTKELEVYEVDYCLKECSLALHDNACLINCKACMRNEFNKKKNDACGERCALQKLKNEDFCPGTPTLNDVKAYEGKKCLEECSHEPIKASVCVTKCIRCMTRHLYRSLKESGCDLRCAFKKLKKGAEDEKKGKCSATPTKETLKAYSTEYCLRDCQALPYSSDCFTNCKECMKKRVKQVKKYCYNSRNCVVKKLKKDYLESSQSNAVCRANIWPHLNSDFAGKRCEQLCGKARLDENMKCINRCQGCFQKIFVVYHKDTSVLTLSGFQRWRQVSIMAFQNEKAFCNCNPSQHQAMNGTVPVTRKAHNPNLK